MKQTIKLYTSKKSGDLDYTYKPLRNMYESVSDYSLKDFTTKNLHYTPDNPVTIECQESYDGSVNLLITDYNDVPRIINSAFTVQENDKYERIVRNQAVATNYYADSTVDSTTRLQRSLSADSNFLTINLKSVEEGGQLLGGNYVFMIKYCDEDNNETSIISESGIVSIFKGTTSSNVEGTIANEATNKSVALRLTNLDPAYNRFKIVYKRSFCDLTGTLDYEFKEIKNPYKVNVLEDGSMLVYILGTEPTIDVTYDSIIAQVNIYDSVRTEAQVQNTLFFGNVAEQVEQQVLLQKLSYFIPVTAIKDQTVEKGYYHHKTGDTYLKEYTNPNNIYSNLGYMPGEIYRFGIVYIYNNDSVSSVYNLRGNKLQFNVPTIDQLPESLSSDLSLNFDLTETFISDYENTKGVFIMPDTDWIESSGNYTPIGLKFEVSDSLLSILKSLGIKGYYFVRQKRIPNFIAQGLSIGISNKAHIPMLPNGDSYFTHGIVTTIDNDEEYTHKLGKTHLTSKDVTCRGLMCVDAYLNRNIQSLLNGSVFTLVKVGEYEVPFNQHEREIRITRTSDLNNIPIESSLVYIPENTSSRIYNSQVFSTKAGSAEEMLSVRSLTWNSYDDSDKQTMDSNLVRGNYAPYIGAVSPSGNDSFKLDKKSIYNIYSEYCESIEDWRKAINKRVYDKSEFTAISDRISIVDVTDALTHIIYRGDCFSGEVSTKFQWNFLDYNTPLNNTIVKPKLKWPVNSKDDDALYTTTKWDDLNISDWNAIPIGYNVTYRYISNFNMSVRCIDSQHVDEKALFGSDRTFYPLTAYVDSTAWKLPESNLLNDGLNTTMTCLPNFEVELVPYIKHTFDNRIAFSEIQQQGGFQNGYRIFKGLQYQDIDSSYGAIVKLLPYGSNLFCVFEHGCGIVPVNEKALFSTTTGQSIHLKGTGVIQSQVTVVSQDYGSTHEDSVIVTPGGIYGVDVFAKKIWRFASNQFTLISDQYVQRFLNDNISDPIKDVWLGFKNVKTHYNNYKGDVMFTFYTEDKCWNLCYNERIGKFTTKYSWTPLLSENIQNSFISFNKEPATIYSLITNNATTTKGLIVDKNRSFYYSLPVTTTATPTFDPVIYPFKDVRVNSITYPVLTDGIVSYKAMDINKAIYEYDDTGFIDTIIIENSDIIVNIDVDTTWTIKVSANRPDFFTTWVQINLSAVYGIQSFTQTICVAVKTDADNMLSGQYRELYDKTLVSMIYTHGFAGNHKELNYLDSNPNNQLKPTYWYDKQEPFEFEFVVNTPTGIQKIFNNLSIISNNAEPQSLEISLIGDSYDFNKANIYKSEHFVEPKFKDGVFDENQYNIDKQDLEFNNTEYSQDFVNMNGIQYETSIDFDPILNQYYLKVKDDCRNIKDSKYGRRLGNIEYKEDKWNLTLTPIYYKQKELKNGEIIESKINSTRIRDKWIKVRIKYTGEKLVVISAIQTLMTLSFA